MFRKSIKNHVNTLFMLRFQGFDVRIWQFEVRDVMNDLRQLLNMTNPVIMHYPELVEIYMTGNGVVGYMLIHPIYAKEEVKQMIKQDPERMYRIFDSESEDHEKLRKLIGLFPTSITADPDAGIIRELRMAIVLDAYGSINDVQKLAIGLMHKLGVSVNLLRPM